MTHNTDDLRIRSQLPLLAPSRVLQELPVSEKAAEVVATARRDAAKVISGQDDRLLVIVGPCSVHDPKAALEYAALLQAEARKHAADLLIIMRVYFEKPRTTVGWKGLTNDPQVDGAEFVTDAAARIQKAGLNTRLVVDCSHGNSSKDHRRQPLVAADIAAQVGAGTRVIAGVMIESHLVEGRQDWKGQEASAYGCSITDACISFPETVPVLAGLAAAVRARRVLTPA